MQPDGPPRGHERPSRIGDDARLRVEALLHAEGKTASVNVSAASRIVEMVLAPMVREH